MNFGATDSRTRPADFNVTNKYEYLISNTAPYYSPSNFATVLDTATNEWYALNISGPTQFFRYGATTQYNPKTNLTHTFGGYGFYDEKTYVLRELITMDAFQGQWYEEDSLIGNTEDISGRFQAASAIVMNKYFVVLQGKLRCLSFKTFDLIIPLILSVGMTMQSSNFIDISEVDVFLLPDVPDGNTNYTEYKMDLLDAIGAPIETTSEGLATKYIIAIVIVCVALFIILPIIIIMLKRRRVIKSVRMVILAVVWDQR